MTDGSSPAVPVTDDPFFPRLKALVIETTGMAFYADKDGELARILGERIEAAGVKGCARYLDLLKDADRGPAEMDALIAELTIGETYFFRHKEQFDALRGIVMEEVIGRNQALRRIRIWSAGCATGPEPYSLAIMLKREFGTRIAGWHISILATDINQKFLARAREGRYGEWALRAMPDSIRHDCFDKVGDQWAIKPEYKRLVTFQYHNLIKNRFPSIVDNLAGFDIIICRNVIIYFSRDTIRELIPNFYDSLAENGWLIMGHAEPDLELFRRFRGVNTGGAVLYQKAPPPSPAPPRPFPVVAAPPPRSPTAPRLRERSRPAAPPPPSPPAPVSFTAKADGLARMRELADRGQWDEAIKEGDRLLADNVLDARLHFYRGLVLEQSGAKDESEKALRRAIYLDRHMVLPHYHLGLFMLSRNEIKAAAKSFRNVLTLLENLDDDQPLGEGDDITVGQLRETVEMHLGLIGTS